MTPDEARAMTYPLFARPRVRGVYCKISNGAPLGPDHERLKNRTMYDILSGLPAFEGVLLLGDGWDEDTAAETAELINEPDLCERFTFWVHDLAMKLPFQKRLPTLAQWIITSHNVCVRPVPYALIHSAEGLLSFEEDVKAAGHAGVVTYGPDDLYARAQSLH